MTGMPVREVPVPEGCTPDALKAVHESESFIAIYGTSPSQKKNMAKPSIRNGIQSSGAKTRDSPEGNTET